ncbi:MAG: hypothetical protein JW822_10010 [Spirochaetales bacterium]|nr:hypothetical protein [Spirochaetales bacterium]
MNEQQTIPDIILERYILGELDEQETQYINALAAENKVIQKRIKEIQSSDKEILLKYPAEQMARQIHKKLARRTPEKNKKPKNFLFRPLPLAGLAGACALLLAVLFITPLFFTSEPGMVDRPDDTTRVKGSDMKYDKPLLSIFRKNGSHGEQLKDGSTVYAHDRIQVQYFAARDQYGVIFSIDGRGKVSLHFPYREDASTLLTQHKKVFLADSFELDDAPDFERFFFISSEFPLNTEEILSKAKQIAKHGESSGQKYLELPKQLNQTTFTLIKGDN